MRESRALRTFARAAAVVALIGPGAGTARAAPVAPAPASAPVRVITDIAGWHHPVKAVFEKYRLSLMQVTLAGAHATFRVAFPFDPQTQPNAATMDALYKDLLRANGWHGYALESPQDAIEIDVAWNPGTRAIALAYRRL